MAEYFQWQWATLIALVIEAANMPWLASPLSGVEQKPLEWERRESEPTTSIVRYRPGASFSSHVHTDDDQGSLPAGTYVRNPPGSTHAPVSKTGCVIFVKLCKAVAA